MAAPRLKDAGLPPSRMRQAYTEMLVMLRNMYQKCRLVHADLSGARGGARLRRGSARRGMA